MAVFLAGGFRAQGLASRVQAVASGLEHGGVAPLSFSDLWMPLLLVSVEGFTADFTWGGMRLDGSLNVWNVVIALQPSGVLPWRGGFCFPPDDEEEIARCTCKCPEAATGGFGSRSCRH